MKKRGRSKTSQSKLIKNKYNYAFSYEELSNALNRSNYTINAFFRLFLKYFFGKQLFKVAKGKIYTRIHLLGTRLARVGEEARAPNAPAFRFFRDDAVCVQLPQGLRKSPNQCVRA